MLSTEEFKRCAQEYMDMVFRVAFSCLRSQADAEDVTQEVLLRLYESDYVFESRAHIKNWLVKVTYNEDGTVSIELDRTKRIVVVLYYLEGYQIQEIAGILKIPPGTVGTRLARARKELRKYLEEEVSV